MTRTKQAFLPLLAALLLGGCSELPATPTDVSRGEATSTLNTSTSADSCKRTPIPLIIRLSRNKYPETTLHLEVAIRDYGHARVLRIDRVNDERNRDAWHRVIDKGEDLDGDGKVEDLDEWPMASSKAPTVGRLASIALVKPSDNRGAGATVGNKLRGYCDGQRFIVQPYGRRAGKTKILLVADHGKRMRKWITASK